jgi:tetratricopeptide (TPR) repeat protein
LFLNLLLTQNLEMNNRHFEIYRPPKTSNRVEDFLFKKGGWAPSQKYDYKLWDIANQFTPAEAYRHKMKTSGQHIRMLQRLEWRWQRAFEQWWKSALIVQAGYRGMVGRRYFHSIKDKLQRERKQRETYALTIQLFHEGDKEGCLEALGKCDVLTTELHIIKCKIMYQIKRFDACKKASRTLMQDFPSIEDGYYILCCCLARERKFPEVYDLMKEMMSSVDVPSVNAYKLHGMVCTKLAHPPMYECCYALNAQYETQPYDMEALLLRAAGYSMAQDWKNAIRDYNTILHYQPYLTNVLCLRARAFACTRRWKEAQADYELVLSWYPQDETAWYGLADVTQPYDSLPMIDHSLVADASES